MKIRSEPDDGIIVRQLLSDLYQLLNSFGGFGLLLFGTLDSSFVFLPFGNDLLLVTMTARQHARWPYFAAMAAAGSVLGCLITDTISRKGGEAGLEKRLPPRRLAYVKKKMTRNAGWALAIAALMPPPFPFTPFVAAAAALQYPRKKLLTTVAVSRLGRFSFEASLAIIFGRRILRWTETRSVYYTVLAIVAVSIIGTGTSVYSWLKKSRNSCGASSGA